MTRPRLTTRRLMATVAVLAILLAAAMELKRKSDHYRKLADYFDRKLSAAHEELVRESKSKVIGHFYTPEVAAESERLGMRWSNKVGRYSSLAEKYHQAARYPWLPVKPDPLEPETDDFQQ
jgi:hypothetical protein